MMPGIILIRPKGQNESLESRFREKGFSPLVYPVLDIVEVPIDDVSRQRVMNLDVYDHVIFVSRNAVGFGLPYVDQYWPQLPMRLKWYAIGQASAAALEAEGIDAITPAEATSEGLLQMKPLQDLANARVLIFRGVGGRETLAEGLASRGAKVDYVEVYKREPALISQEGVQTVNSMQSGIVLAYSGESLRAFCDSFSPESSRFVIIVPTDRVKQVALALGFESISVAGGPDDDAMFASAEQAAVS